MRIWDIFPFFNELDLLECRLVELSESHVYRHILIEAPTTFQGDPKPLYFMENRERFAPWADRIVHVVTGKIPGISPWIREAIQREYAAEGLKDASPEDIVMLGDVDEIPRGSCVRADMETETVLSMSAHMFAVDWLHPDPWRGTVVAPLKRGLKSFQVLRDMRNYWTPQPDSGWHFSFLGGAQAIREKVNAFSHPELRDLIPGWLDEGHLYEDGKTFTDTLELSVQQQGITVDETFPRWIQERRCPQEWFRPL